MSVPSGTTRASSGLQGRRAAEQTTEKNFTRVTVPLIGTVTLPPPDQLAFLAGVAALVALEVIEWPVGLALTAGHMLAAHNHSKIMREFGEALQEA